MKLIIFWAFGLLMLPLAAISQELNAHSVCTEPAVGDGAILTICNHEYGMVAWPQPTLGLRLYADGRGEYEMKPSWHEGEAYPEKWLVVNEFKATAEELEGITAILDAPDLQNAKNRYSYYHRGIDTSIETTLIINTVAGSQKIVLGNSGTFNPDNRKYYPPSLQILMVRAEALVEHGKGIVRPISVIAFCNLVKNHELYFGQKVSINADLTYADPFSFFNDAECDRPEQGQFRTKEKVGVGFAGNSGEQDALKAKLLTIRDPRFAGRARVYVTGILRVDTARSESGFNYRFDLADLSTMEPIYVPYQGKLEAGWMYSDTFDHVVKRGLQLSSPLKIQFHHAARIEWTNVDKFPYLGYDGRKYITFRVLSREINIIGRSRWNDTYTCEIIDVK